MPTLSKPLQGRMHRWLIHVARAIGYLLLSACIHFADHAARAEENISQEQMLEVGEVTFGPIDLPPEPPPRKTALLDAATRSRVDNVMQRGDWVSPAPQVPGATPGRLVRLPQVDARLISSPLEQETLRVDTVTLSRIDDVMQFGDLVSPAPQIPGGLGEVYQLRLVQGPSQPLDFSPNAMFDSVGPSQPLDIGGGGGGGNTFESFNFAADLSRILNTVAEGVNSSQESVLAMSDTGALLQASTNVQTVKVQQRSPVAFNPHIRGYNVNQIYSVGDGALWVSAREDLDSMLSKIDPSQIQNVTVIPGPYGLRYGPGFSFIDVVTADTPRYDGYEGHSRFGMSYHANGERIYGRETVYGGNTNYGYVIGYGNRTGNDYAPGGNAPISLLPSSYHNQNFYGQLGFDLSPDSDIEFRYSRMDQVRTEYAAQFFDVSALATDGFNVAYNYRSPVWDRTTRVQAWHNTTNFAGDTNRKRQQNFPVIERVDAALNGVFNPPAMPPPIDARLNADTSGDLSSSGARTMSVWGAQGDRQLALGADFRNINQGIVENYDIVDQTAPLPPGRDPDLLSFSTNLPRSDGYDPGVFAEITWPVRSYWTTKVGGRIDYYSTSADAGQLRSNTSLPGVDPADPSTFGVLNQNDVLLAFYLTNDINVNDNTTIRIGGGHAQRGPTLRERYADGLFLAIIQDGFSRVIGNPSLRKERAWQIDLGVDYEDDVWRGNIHAFGSWIEDYITYTGNLVGSPLGARLLQTINTDYATLAGIEAAGEVNVTPMISTYASISYVDGRDHGIDRALPQIAPLQGRIGVRWHDPADEPRWGTDFGFRMVNNQAMVGYVHNVVGGGPDPILVESPTPGFMTAYLRGYYNFSESVNFVGGVENLFDKTYYEHLDLRLPNQGPFTNTTVYSPGITPYMGIEWTR